MADPAAGRARKKRKVAEAAPVLEGLDIPEDPVSGQKLEGTISSWYTNGTGLLGSQDYGYIERVTPGKDGGLGFMEHHYFEDLDTPKALRPKLKVGMKVKFQSGGRDSLGRWRATHVRADEQEEDSKAGGSVTQKPIFQIAGPKAPVWETIEVDAGPTPMERTRAIVLKAWKKLGGEVTVYEVLDKVATDPKLSRKVEDFFGDRQNSGDEVFEELVPKVLKADGVPTGEKRPPTSGEGRPSKVYRRRDE
mmetsp:Transcript_85343/g.187379  ORF Transcript_85343/g.187379 Transcript_85343/m.187379 type:complete len:249 (-) Transcript_85343:110-856(-)